MEQLQKAADTKECPYCSEQIIKTAKKCRFCGEILDAQMRDIEALKKQRNNNNQNTIVNNVIAGTDRRNFPHLGHLVMTVITMGFWFWIWLLHYIFRDRKTYF